MIKHTLEKTLSRFHLSFFGFLREIRFRVERGLREAKGECLKNCHDQPLKTENTHFFRGLASREVTREKCH